MDIRFRPEKHEVERVSGNSQFGHSFDSWGNRFTVWNNDHMRPYVVIQVGLPDKKSIPRHSINDAIGFRS